MTYASRLIILITVVNT